MRVSNKGPRISGEHPAPENEAPAKKQKKNEVRAQHEAPHEEIGFEGAATQKQAAVKRAGARANKVAREQLTKVPEEQLAKVEAEELEKVEPEMLEKVAPEVLEKVPREQLQKVVFKKVAAESAEEVEGADGSEFEASAPTQPEPAVVRGEGAEEVEGLDEVLAPEGEPTAEGEEPLAGPGLSEDELSRLGKDLGENPPKIPFNELSVNLIEARSVEQGVLPTERGDSNGELAASRRQRVDPEGTGELQRMTGSELGALVRDSGVPVERIDASQLTVATNYINGANDADEQQERIRKTLNSFAVLDTGLPKLSKKDTTDILWETARVPKHALEKLNDAQLKQALTDVSAATGNPGENELKIGSHNLKMTVSEGSEVTASSTKKPSLLSRAAGIIKKALPIVTTALALTGVGGPIAAGLKLVNAAWKAYDAIKAKSLSGLAGAVAAGFGAGAKLFSGAERFLSAGAKVANGLKDGITAWNAGRAAIREKNWGAAFDAIGLAAKGAAGAFGAVGKTFAAAARVATRVADGAQAARFALDAYASAKAGDYFGVAVNSLNAAASVGDVVKPAPIPAATADGVAGAENAAAPVAPERFADKARRFAGYASTAGTVRASIQQRDYFGAASATAAFASTLTGVKKGPDGKPLTDAEGKPIEKEITARLNRASRFFTAAGGAQTAIRTRNWVDLASSGANLASSLVSNEKILAQLTRAEKTINAAGLARTALKGRDWAAAAAQIANAAEALAGKNPDATAAALILGNVTALRALMASGADADEIIDAAETLGTNIRKEVGEFTGRHFPRNRSSAENLGASVFEGSPTIRQPPVTRPRATSGSSAA